MAHTREVEMTDVVIVCEELSPEQKIAEQRRVICGTRAANFELWCKNSDLTKQMHTLKNDRKVKSDEIARLKEKLDFYEKLTWNFERFLGKTQYEHTRKYKYHIKNKSFPIVPFYHR